MSDPRVLARLSELVYEPDAGRNNLPAGWAFLEDSAGAGVPATNGYYGAAYQNTVTQEIVIAHRGTEKSSLADWRNNLANLLGKIPYQFPDAQLFDTLVRNTYLSGSRSSPIEQTGHSLGGGLATMVAVANRQAGIPIQNQDRAYTFNPIGVQAALQTAGLSTTGDLSYVRNVSSYLDPARNVGTRVGLTEYVHVPIIAGMPAVVEAVVAFIGIKFLVALGAGGVGLPAFLYNQHNMSSMRNTLDVLPASRIQQLAPDLVLNSDWTLSGSLASYMQPLTDLAASNTDFAAVLSNTIFENPGDSGPALVQEQSNNLTKTWRYVGTAGADFQVGGSGADMLSGGGGADVQFAGAGADTLEGGAGKDWMVGGAGVDTYLLSAGDGQDRIVDTDQNRIIRDRQLIAGDFIRDSQSGVYRWAVDPGVTLSFGSPATIAFAGGDSVMLVNQTDAASFAEGAFGIRLIDAPAQPVTTLTITGDITPTDTNPSVAGIQAEADAQGNPIGIAQPYEDILRGSAGNDHIVAGALNDDISSGGGGDWIEGGSGNDFIYGDTGNDLIEGGAGRRWRSAW